jgi:purine-binding chemotaxis protein CheW
MADQFLLDDDEENAQENKFLLFNLGDELYGVPISHVINIIERQKITEVPDLPAYLRGVINLRGSVIPVLDLRLRFHLPEREYDDRTCIVIVQMGTRSFGLICDTVAEVDTILPQDIDPQVDFGGQRGRYIAGLGKVKDGVRILLDVERILTEEEQAAATAG